METYKLFLLALVWGAFLAALYIAGAIPAWFALVFGWGGGILIYARFA